MWFEDSKAWYLGCTCPAHTVYSWYHPASFSVSVGLLRGFCFGKAAREILFKGNPPYKIFESPFNIISPLFVVIIVIQQNISLQNITPVRRSVRLLLMPLFDTHSILWAHTYAMILYLIFLCSTTRWVSNSQLSGLLDVLNQYSILVFEVQAFAPCWVHQISLPSHALWSSQNFVEGNWKSVRQIFLLTKFFSRCKGKLILSIL